MARIMQNEFFTKKLLNIIRLSRGSTFGGSVAFPSRHFISATFASWTIRRRPSGTRTTSFQ